MADNERRSSRTSRRSDALLGYLIPLAFVALATYQEIHDHQIDKYVIGALLVFGLGALGWRIDSIFDAYVKAKSTQVNVGTIEDEPRPPQSRARKPRKKAPDG